MLVDELNLPVGLKQQGKKPETNDLALEHERLRVQLALVMQLAGITGNRPGALLRLCYEDLQIALMPNGDQPPQLLMELTFKYIKSYLQAKEASVLA